MARGQKTPNEATKYRSSNLSGNLSGSQGWEASRGRDDLTVNQRVLEAIEYTPRWSRSQRQLAEKYVDALIFGNARPPRGMHETDQVTIQQYFTKVCLNIQLSDGKLPGQKTSWYRPCKKDVEGLQLPCNPKSQRRRRR